MKAVALATLLVLAAGAPGAHAAAPGANGRLAVSVDPCELTRTCARSPPVAGTPAS